MYLISKFKKVKCELQNGQASRLENIQFSNILGYNLTLNQKQGTTVWNNN